MDILSLKAFTNNLTVLYVEDSTTIRKITQKLLSAFFPNIDTAKDGQEASELYKNYYNENEKFYDIVFTDLEMPIMDGEDLSKKILNFNIDQEIVVISSSEDFRRVIKLTNIGIKKFISKPVEEEQLAEIIDAIVQDMRKKRLELADKEEIEEYNTILKQREEENKKVLEKKVKELEEFSDALDVSAIVVKTTPQGIITYVNQLYCNISGYTKEELIGHNVNIINSGSKPQMYYKKLWNKITHKETYQILFDNKHKDGSIYYVNSTISPILDTNDEIVEYISVSYDMTLLMKSLDAKNEAEKSKENFFINISHEMKTPLNAILGFSSILLKHVQDNPKALKMVQSIQETGKDLNNLVTSILDINQFKEQKFELENAPFHPKEIFATLLEEYRKKAFQKTIHYTVSIDKLIPNTLIADEKRLSRVVGIVVDNAIKFTNEHEGKVNIELFYDKKLASLICEVKDNGVGIAHKDQAKIFQIQQVDGSTTRKHEGAGLGLTIADSIMKLMQGKIKVKSIEGHGSLFILEFPVKIADEK